MKSPPTDADNKEILCCLKQIRSGTFIYDLQISALC